MFLLKRLPSGTVIPAPCPRVSFKCFVRQFWVHVLRCAASLCKVKHCGIYFLPSTSVSPAHTLRCFFLPVHHQKFLIHVFLVRQSLDRLERVFRRFQPSRDFLNHRFLASPGTGVLDPVCSLKCVRVFGRFGLCVGFRAPTRS